MSWLEGERDFLASRREGSGGEGEVEDHHQHPSRKTGCSHRRIPHRSRRGRIVEPRLHMTCSVDWPHSSLLLPFLGCVGLFGR